MEAENGLVEYAETIAAQVHGDIKDKVKTGELPEGAVESVAAHKQLISMHILHGFRFNGDESDLDHEYIEMVAEHASQNAISA